MLSPSECNARSTAEIRSSGAAIARRSFLATADRYTPRQWAEANISCFKSSVRLNEILKRDALADGQEWTRDLFPLCWQPDPRLVYPADWQSMKGERADIKARFGVTLGPEELPG